MFLCIIFPCFQVAMGVYLPSRDLTKRHSIMSPSKIMIHMLLSDRYGALKKLRHQTSSELFHFVSISIYAQIANFFSFSCSKKMFVT